MARRKHEGSDYWLTVYLPDGAVAGRVLRFSDTGLDAHMDEPVPPYERFRFTLQLPHGMVTGELTGLCHEGRECRLQFAALTDRDRARLEPLIDPDA